MSNSIRRLGDLRGPDVISKTTSRSIFVQPLGAIEQHGPHLPLNTDEIVATAVAEATVERIGEKLDVWLLPTLTYTKSNEHAWAPGTIWLSATTMLNVLDDIGKCISRTNAQKLV
ncbi:MAG: creatininase family protein, partial [Acidimicrobiaceae bacterium]